MNPDRGEQYRTQSIDWDPLGDATRERLEIKMTGAQLMDLIDEREQAKAELVAVRSALRSALRSTRDELAKHGWGDMHYGSNMPQQPSVVAALAVADAALGGLGNDTAGG